ncbi:MAG: serine protease [Patescibacteria group bacterium]
MKKFLRDIVDNLLSIFIGIVLILFLIINIRTVNRINNELATLVEGQRIVVQQFINFRQYISDGIKRDIELNKSLNLAFVELKKYIDDQEIKQKTIEKKLLLINIGVENISAGVSGSGSTIKYNNKFYILTAGHLVNEETDILWLIENGQQVCQLKIVKIENNFPKSDLLLLEPINSDFFPKVYAEISQKEPLQADNIYIVGNPMGISDVLSDGRIIKFGKYYTYLIGNSYFGNSGGGIFNQEGLLIGVMSYMIPYDPNPGNVIGNRLLHYVVHGSVNLSEIKKFLADVK